MSEYLTQTRGTGGNPTATTVSSSRAVDGTSLTVDSLDNWSPTTGNKIHFITYKKTTAGAIDKSTQCDWTAVIPASGTTLTSLTLQNGTDAGNDVDDFVEMAPTASWAQGVYDFGKAEHNTDGTHGDITPTSVTTGDVTATGDVDLSGASSVELPSGIELPSDFTINGVKLGYIVSDSNLGSRSQGLTASGSATTVYSTNNPTMTLAPGTYLVVATASARATISTQDSSFAAAIYNDTASSELVNNGTTSTGTSTTIYPTYSAHAIVSPTANTTYSSRIRQSFGTGAAYTYVNSTLIAVPLSVVPS